MREQDWGAGDGSVLLTASFSISERAARQDNCRDGQRVRPAALGCKIHPLEVSAFQEWTKFVFFSLLLGFSFAYSF